MDTTRWTFWFPLALLLLLAGLTLWVALIRWWYRLRHPRPLPMRVRCRDGWELTVHSRSATHRRYEEPVLLCHGLAANHYTFDFDPPYSVAHYLAEAGFDCFSVEWRGTGASRFPPKGRRPTDFSVDDHVLHDAPALLELALQRTGARRALWLGHSLGALVGYALAQGPHASQLAGLVALGAPVYLRSEPLLRALVGLGLQVAWPYSLRHAWISGGLAPFLGYLPLPFSDVVANPRHVPPRIQRQLSAHLLSAMSRKVLLQFQDWIANDCFRSFDKQNDWRAGLARLSLPVLVLGGSADKLATPANLQAQFQRLGSQDKALHIFGRERGDAMDYGHGDLLFGSGAPHELYPVIRSWLEAHATPLAASSEAASVGRPLHAGASTP